MRSVRVHVCEAVISVAAALVVLGCSCSYRVCLGPACLLPICDGRTEPAVAVACGTCVTPWLLPLLPLASLGAMPFTGCAWRPPAWRNGQRVGWMCRGRGWVLGESKSVSQLHVCKQKHICIYIYIDIKVYRCVCIYIYRYT